MALQLEVGYSWNSILHTLFEVAGVVLIEGTGKIGKTDLALKLSDDLTKLPARHSDKTHYEPLIRDVASNIDTEGHYPQVSDLISLKQWLYSNNHRKLYILDEANEYLSNLRTMSSQNVGFTRLLPQVTKAHARMIVVGHDFNAIDKNILRNAWCKGMFRKQNLKSALLISNLLPQPFEFTDIPRTSISFDPYVIAPFSEKPAGNIYFKDEDKQLLWKWANGANYKELGILAMQLHRKLQKYILQTLESEFNA